MRTQVARLLGTAISLIVAICVVSPAAQADPPGARTHLVGTYDGATLRLYVDGKLAASRAVTGAVRVTSAPVEIGSYLGEGIFIGTLGDIAVYDRPLSAATVQRHYQLGTEPGSGKFASAVTHSPGVLAYWPLYDRTAARAVDIVGRLDGTYRPGSVREVPGLTSNRGDQAVAFNGSRGGVVIPAGKKLGLRHGFTLEAWAAAGVDGPMTVITKPNAWFMKTDLVGQWGVGFYATGGTDPLPSVYSRARARISRSPAPSAAVPAAAASPSRTAKSKDSSGSIGLIALIVLAVLGIGAWLVFGARHDRELEEEILPDEPDDPGPGDDPEDSPPRAGPPAASGSSRARRQSRREADPKAAQTALAEEQERPASAASKDAGGPDT